MIINSVGDRLLILGATMRLTRLVVTDDLGQWLIHEPIDAWMHVHPGGKRYEELMAEHARLLAQGADPEQLAQPAEPTGELPRLHWHKWTEGLSCPFCVGYWIGAGVLLSHLLVRRTALIGPWRFIIGSLALNEVSAHLGVKVGDFE